MTMKRKKEHAIPKSVLERLKNAKSQIDELARHQQRIVDIYNTTAITAMEVMGLEIDKWQVDLDAGLFVPKPNKEEVKHTSDDTDSLEAVGTSDNGKSD